MMTHKIYLFAAMSFAAALFTGCSKYSVSGTIDGHDYVDLSLPSGTLWATCNIGAATPEEYGDYFAWGETSAKSDYSWATYQFGDQSRLTKYCIESNLGEEGFTDKRVALESADDAATVLWGERWCMPTREQWVELLDYCECKVTSRSDGVTEMTFTSKKNGNVLYLSAGGFYAGSTLCQVELMGEYWSGTLDPTYSGAAKDFSFGYGSMSVSENSRDTGGSIRPVVRK